MAFCIYCVLNTHDFSDIFVLVFPKPFVSVHLNITNYLFQPEPSQKWKVLYLLFSVAYFFTERKGKNGITSV